MFKYIGDIVKGTGTQLRSMVMVFGHGFRKRDTLQYPEEQVYLPPRYRGRIVLTRDPDGEERCVACNLCAVACPVGCISLQKAETEDGRWYPDFSVSTSHAAFSVACAKKPARLPQSSLRRTSKWPTSSVRIWSTRRKIC